jgi:hypothetical protein
MAIWFWLALALNSVVWSIFLYLLSRRRWNIGALFVGILHMLFSVILSVAPFRSFLDPNYHGLGLGFLQLEGIAATLSATLIFGWAVATAWVSVSKGRGRWMMLILVGDIFLALNFGGSTLLEGSSDNWRIDFGEGRSITGLAGALILLLFFTVPFVGSAIWAASRGRSNGTSLPLTTDLQETRDDTDDHTKDINSFRFSESRV